MTPDGILRLDADEGFRNKMYTDTRGFVTIGKGTDLSNGITERQADALRDCELSDNLKMLMQWDWFWKLSEVRRDVIENMAYNLGVTGLLQFHNMISKLAFGNFHDAAYEILNSAAAKETGGRYSRLAKAMVYDTWDDSKWK